MSAIDEAFIRAYENVVPSPPIAPAIASPAKTPPRGSAAVAVAAQPTAPSPQRTIPLPPRTAANVESMLDAPIVAASPPAGPAERRPLSAFVPPNQSVEARFRPSLEVDFFRWPAVSNVLVRRCAGTFHSVLGALLAADETGRSLIGVAAPTAGTGCTTMLGCMARLLVEVGKTVAIVDANFAAPGLASHLGLAVDAGWENVLAGQASLAEVVVHSLGDRVALVPLATGGVAAAERLESIHASITAGILRYHYDMVLFDLGAVVDEAQGPIARRVIRQCRLDGALVATGFGPGSVQPHLIAQSTPELANICLGVVENRARAA